MRYYPDICLEDMGKPAIHMIYSVPRCERETYRLRNRCANYSATAFHASVC